MEMVRGSTFEGEGLHTCFLFGPLHRFPQPIFSAGKWGQARFVEKIAGGGRIFLYLSFPALQNLSSRLSQLLSQALDQRGIVVDSLALHAKSCIPEGVDQAECFCLGKQTQSAHHV